MTNTDVQQPNYGRPDFGRPNFRHPQGQKMIELTAEETEVWHDCMKNSSVITPTVICAATSYGLFKLTRFRANAKYAALFGGIMGLITGRVTTTELCLAKVASMPNSTLRERLMEASYGKKYISEKQIFRSPDATSQTQGSEELSTGIVFNDYPSMNSYDTYSSFNDSGDVSISEDIDLTEPINLQKNTLQEGTTYEELRHKNREEYRKKGGQYSQMPQRYSMTETTQQQQPQRQTPANTPMDKTKYGDVWG